MRTPAWVGVLLAIVRHYVSAEVIAAVKAKVLEALARDDWSQGEKTAFVIDSVREVVATTPTPIDDFLVELAARLYLKKYARG